MKVNCSKYSYEKWCKYNSLEDVLFCSDIYCYNIECEECIFCDHCFTVNELKSQQRIKEGENNE